MIIYKITNNITNKSYIGQTRQTLEKRWYQHKKDVIRRNQHFHNAINKYGTECWHLEINSPELLNDREIYWIAFYNTFNNGYNSTTGGGQGYFLSEESKKKMSEKSKGNKNCLCKEVSQEKRNKISQKLLGNKVSEQTKEKLRLFNRGKTLSEEHKEKISISNKGKIRTEKARKKMSESHIGKPSPKRGIPLSNEQKIKISETLKRRHQEKLSSSS